TAAADVRGASVAAGDNLEQTARRMRQEFFSGLIDTGHVDRIALGHTRSDQAETVLFRILRGAGLRGLAGVLPVTREGLVRPLLEIDRSGVEAWLRERGIAWREDSTNTDLSFARNRIRRRLLPQLSSEWNPELAAGLAKLAMLAGDEESFWNDYIEDIAARILRRQRAGVVLFRSADLVALPRAVGRRLLRRAIELVKGDVRQLEMPHIELLLELAAQPEGSGRAQIPGVDVFRSFDWVRLATPRPGMFSERDYEVELGVPGVAQVPRGRTEILLEVVENTDKTTPSFACVTVEEVDWRSVPGQLYLRNWRPGDQYRPVGHAAEQKIKLLFQQARIPLWERGGWPIITSRGNIVWARQFGPAAQYAANSTSESILRVRERVLSETESPELEANHGRSTSQ
ncbi:MAG: tRNA lysidine(34) synthetase TilS, partial [Bryobacteraceae bacterium]